MKLLLIFIALNIVNVILQTVRSICTVKCGKTVAAIVNALAYGLYTVVIVYTNADLPLMAKVAVVALSNLVGVYVVKLIEEKKAKELLWKVECTVHKDQTEEVDIMLVAAGISHNLIKLTNSDYNIFNIFCETQKQSLAVKEIISKFNAKYFVSETKIL